MAIDKLILWHVKWLPCGDGLRRIGDAMRQAPRAPVAPLWRPCGSEKTVPGERARECPGMPRGAPVAPLWRRRGAPMASTWRPCMAQDWHSCPETRAAPRFALDWVSCAVPPAPLWRHCGARRTPLRGKAAAPPGGETPDIFLTNHPGSQQVTRVSLNTILLSFWCSSTPSRALGVAVHAVNHAVYPGYRRLDLKDYL